MGVHLQTLGGTWWLSLDRPLHELLLLTVAEQQQLLVEWE